MKIKLAGCVIKNSEGKILLIHRNTTKRKQWELPGGKIEENEDPKETAKRELKEELNIEVEVKNKIGEKDFGEDKFTMKYIWFEGIIKAGEVKLLEDAFDDYNYFSKQELKEMKKQLSPNVQNLISSQDI